MFNLTLQWSYKGPDDLHYYVLQHKPKNANQVSLIKSKNFQKLLLSFLFKFLTTKGL
jgi:hypothetical protein